MLTYFPTPYPEELWYSVLCRYHNKSGNSKYATTTRELFGSSRKIVNIWTGGHSFSKVFEQLPKHIFSAEEIYLHHTLNPYLLRFTQAIRREEAQRYILQGEEVNTLYSILKPWNLQNAKLRYCPLCAAEERTKYGEAYWHCAHQIQMMPLCPKHLCYLEDSLITVNTTKERYLSASPDFCSDKEPRYSSNMKDKLLSLYLYDFWKKPFYEEQNPDRIGRLITARLQETGYLLKSNTRVQKNTLFADLCSFWGREKVCSVLGDKWFWTNIYKITSEHKEFFSPEGYALLAIFLNIDCEALLNPNVGIIHETEIKLRKMADSGMQWSKKRVAEELGIHSYQLDSLSETYGIKPFWHTTSKGKPNPQKREQFVIKAYVSKEERDLYVTHAKRIGFSSVSAYMKYCLEKETKNQN